MSEGLLGVVLHSCPLSPHGTKLGSTPQPESAPCPDTLAHVPEALVFVVVVTALVIVIGRVRQRWDDE